MKTRTLGVRPLPSVRVGCFGSNGIRSRVAQTTLPILPPGALVKKVRASSSFFSYHEKKMFSS